jgi:hypothetical protein
MFVVALITAMTAMAIGAGAVLAAAPGNDLKQDPAHFGTLGTVISGSTVEATSAGEPVPSCGAGVGKTVWFRFRAPIALKLRANLGTSDFDTVLQAYVATPDGLSRVACNDDGFGLATPSLLTFNAKPGKLYYFQLGGYNGANGHYDFYLDGGPLNDFFATPAVAKALPFVYQEDTSRASGQPGERTDCGSKANSVWFKYKRSTTAYVSADTFGSDYDTVVAVYLGTTLASLTRIDCIDDSGGTLQSQVTWLAVGDKTYYIQVNGKAITDWGALTFALTRN